MQSLRVHGIMGSRRMRVGVLIWVVVGVVSKIFSGHPKKDGSHLTVLSLFRGHGPLNIAPSKSQAPNIQAELYIPKP